MNPSDPKFLKESLRAGDCPGTDRLETYRQQPNASENLEVRRHIAECPACEAELELLASFQTAIETSGERSQVDWILSRLDKPAAVRRSWFSTWFGSYKALATASAMTLIVVAVGLQYRSSQSLPDLPKDVSDGSTMRAAARIEVLAPVSGEVKAAPDEVRWSPVEGAARYEVVLVEVDGTEIPAGASQSPRLTLQTEAKKLFRPHKSMGIRIRARAATEGRILAESSVIRIRVEP